jgi:hypothetical protein
MDPWTLGADWRHLMLPGRPIKKEACMQPYIQATTPR